MASEDLTSRIAALEKTASAIPHNFQGDASKEITSVEEADVVSTTPLVARVAKDILAKSLKGCALYRVPGHYYSLPLSKRAEILGCTPDRLCKTIILKNSAGTTQDPSADIAQHIYIAVVLQYVTKLANDLLERWIKTRLANMGVHVPEVRVTVAAEGCDVAGFAPNGVSPFGLLTHIPLIVGKPITQLPPGAAIWLGGGEVDIKCRVFVSQLLRPSLFGVEGPTATATVLNATYPRDADELGDE